MDITRQHQEQQEAKQLQSRISSFIGDFQIGTLLNKSGIRKLRGVLPLTLFSAIFMLPFEGNNFFRGIVTNENLPFKKNAAYDLLKNPRHNWRKFMLTLASQAVSFFSRLTSHTREKVLIFDDSTYDRSRSKAVEFLAWIFDHNKIKETYGMEVEKRGKFLEIMFTCLSIRNNRLNRFAVGYESEFEVSLDSSPHSFP
jgi:hypothetical protein